MVIEGILLGFFAHNRLLEYRANPTNQIVYRYWLASSLVSLGFLAYGGASLFTENSNIIVWSGFSGMILNAFGFSNFFLIPLYGWLSPRKYVIAKHILFLFPLFLAACMILTPSQSFVDEHSIIHWRFDHAIGIMAALHMDIAFVSNIALLYTHFYRLKKLSMLNAIALMLTFILTGLAGSYQYIGDNYFLLGLSSVILYVGISLVFYSIMRGKINHILEWQNKQSSVTLAGNAK